MVEFIDQKITNLQTKRDTLSKALTDRRIAKDKELGGPGRFNQAKDPTSIQISLNLDRTLRELRTAKDLKTEIGTQAVERKEQLRVFESRRQSQEAGIKRQFIRSQIKEAQAKKISQALRLKARKLGLEPIRVRGRQRFRDIKTKKIITKVPKFPKVTLKPLPPRKLITSIKKRVVKERTFNVLTVPGKRGFLEEKSLRLARGRGDIRTAIQREGTTFQREVALGILTGASLITNTFLGAKQLISLIPKAPKKLVEIAKKPKASGIALVSASKDIPKKVKEVGKEQGRLLRISPTEAFVNIAGEVLLLKGVGKTLKVTGRISEKGLAKIDPRFKGELSKGSKITVSGTKGQNINLQVVGKIGSKTLPRETLKEQISLTGKRINAISVQSNRLVNLVRDKKIIRKPIPNEEKLTGITKKLLKKFDNGKITTRDLNKLDILIQRQRGKGVLERSLFADPRGRIRPSRIGREKEAKLLDIFAGDIKFRSSKPQILLFEDVKVEKLPKSLSDIRKKLKANKPLTNSETQRLLKFQIKKTGKFKPVGFLSKEPEVSLSPGELIKKKKVVGITLINGRRVPIVSVKIIKAKRSTKALIKKANRGRITKSEMKKLKRQLSKETGFKTTSSSALRPGSRVVPIRRLGSSGVVRSISKGRLRKLPRKVSKVPSKKPRPRPRPSPKPRPKPSPRPRPRPSPKPRPKPSPKPRPSPRITTTPGPSPRPRPRPVPRPPVTAKKRIIKKPKKKKRIKKVQIGYNVFGKSKGKLIKLNKIPLRKKDALSRGSFAIDKSTARTFEIRKVKGKVKKFGSIKKKERSYIKKARPKLRGFRKIKGKRVPIRNKFIEKKKFLIDTRGEVRQLTLDRLAKREGFIGRPKRKRRSRPKIKIKTRRKRRSSGFSFFD